MIRRPRLTYANVTSTIALVLALGGGAAYANHEFINSSDVEDNTLTGEDVRGSFPDSQQGFIDGTLTTQDIQDGTLFPSDIADNTIGPADILTVGAGDIGPDAVNGGHVANDSLDGFDIQNLSGADLIDGSVGAGDLAPGVRGFTEMAERSRRRELDRGDSANIIVSCPSGGWRPMGGGFAHTNSRDPGDIAIRHNYKYGRTGWIVSAKHIGGIGADRTGVIAYVTCVR